MGYGVAASGAAMEMMRTMGNSGSAILSKIDESIGKSPISRVTSLPMLIYGVSVLLRCAFILISLIKENLKTIFEQQNKEKQNNMQEDVLHHKIELGDSQQLLLLSQGEQEQSCQDKLTDLSATMKCAKSKLMYHIDQADRKAQAELKDIMEDLAYTMKLAEDTMQLAEESMKAKYVAILNMEAAHTDTRTLKQCEQDFLYDVSSGMHMELYRTSVFVHAQLRNITQLMRNIESGQSMMDKVESTKVSVQTQLSQIERRRQSMMDKVESTKVSVQTQLSQIEEVGKSITDKINCLFDHHQTIFEQQNKEKQNNMQEDVLHHKIELGDSQQLKPPLFLQQGEQEQSCQDKLTDLSATMKCAKSKLVDHMDQADRKARAELKDQADRRDQTIMEDLAYTMKLAEDTMQLADESMKAKSVAILDMEAALTDTRTLKQCEQDFLNNLSDAIPYEVSMTTLFVQAQLRIIKWRQRMMHDMESTKALKLTKVSVQTQLSQIERRRQSMMDKVESTKVSVQTQLSQIEEVRKSLMDKINGLFDHHQTIFEQQNKEKQKNMQEDVWPQNIDLGDSQQHKKLLLLLNQVEQEQSCPATLTELSAAAKIKYQAKSVISAADKLQDHIDQAKLKDQAELKDLANRRDRRDQTIMEDLEYTRKLAEDTMQLAEESMKAKYVAILDMEAAHTDTRTLKQCEQDFLKDVSKDIYMESYSTEAFVQSQLCHIESKQSMMDKVESTKALELTKVSVQTQMSQIDELRKSIEDKINGLFDHHQTIFEQQKNMPEDVLTQKRELGDSQQLKQPLLLSQVEQEQSCQAKSVISAADKLKDHIDQANLKDQANRRDQTIMEDLEYTRKLAEDTMQLAEESMKAKSVAVAILDMEAARTDTRTLKQCEQDFLNDVSEDIDMESYSTQAFVQAQLSHIEEMMQSMMYKVESTKALELTTALESTIVSVQTQLRQIKEVGKSIEDKINGLFNMHQEAQMPREAFRTHARSLSY